MPDQKITVTDEMVAAALNAANEYGRDGGWLTSAGLCRTAVTAALAAAPTTDEPDRSFLDAAADDWHSAAVQASGEALAAASRARRAESALEDLREQYGTAVREKDEWEANAEAADARAEKAEQERDEARESLSRAKGAVESLRTMTARDHLNAARDLGHPLPKGTTIPEGAAFWVRSPGEPWEFVSPGPDEDFDTSPFPNSQYVLLDPKRPDGAEVLARAEAYMREVGDGAIDALDDFLASRGARVVTEGDGGDETPDVCPHVGGPGGDCGCPL